MQQQMQRRSAQPASSTGAATRPLAEAPLARPVRSRRRFSAAAAPAVDLSHSTCCRSHTHTVLAAAVLERTSPVPVVCLPPPQELQPTTFDVLGLAQAMVDFTAAVEPELCEQLRVAKGGRRIITLEERHAAMELLEEAGCQSQVSPGGSLANTLVAISRLAAAHGSQMNVGMAGMVGTDTLGKYFQAQLEKAGVNVVVDKDNLAHTGTVMVLTTPDAQRSFLSFFDSGSVRMTPGMQRAISGSRLVVIEGYMLEVPGAHKWVPQVARAARAAGAQLVLTAGDPTVVARHRSVLRALLDESLIDVVFCNLEEAQELLSDGSAVKPQPQQQQEEQGVEKLAGEARRLAGRALAAELASRATLAVVTDGSRGSFLSMLGDVHECAPHWAPQGPVDVCGAGDAFAAGILFAVSQGYDVETAGRFAARVAAAVIQRHGAQLAAEDACELVQHLPDHVVLPKMWLAGGEQGSSAAGAAAAAAQV